MAQFESNFLTPNDFFCIRNSSFQGPSEDNSSRILQITCSDGSVEIRKKTISSLTRMFEPLSIVSLVVNCEKEVFEAIKDFALIGHCFIQGKRLKSVHGIADELGMKNLKEAIESIINEQSNRVSSPKNCSFTEAEGSKDVNVNCEQGNDVINLEGSYDDQSTIETWFQYKRERKVKVQEPAKDINTNKVTIREPQLSLDQAEESCKDREKDEELERGKIEDSSMKGVWWSEDLERFFLGLCLEHTVVPNHGSAYVRGKTVFKIMVENGYQRDYYSLRNKLFWLQTARMFRLKYGSKFRDVSKDKIGWRDVE